MKKLLCAVLSTFLVVSAPVGVFAAEQKPSFVEILKTYNGKDELNQLLQAALEIPANTYRINVVNVSNADINALNGSYGKRDLDTIVWINRTYYIGEAIVAVDVIVQETVGTEIKAVLDGKRAAERLSEEAKAVYPKVKEVLAKVIKPEMTSYEKEVAIHNYIVLNTVYDYDGYTSGKIADASYTTAGVLLNGKAVCEGYANTFKLFMDVLGIECHIITGEVEGIGHAWNAIKLDGEWYYVDTTWDDPVPDVKDVVRYTYFNVTDEVLKRDHKWADVYGIKATSLKYNYFVQAGTAAYSDEDVKAIIKKAVDAGKNEFDVYTFYETDVKKLGAIVLAVTGKGYSVNYYGSSFSFVIR